MRPDLDNGLCADFPALYRGRRGDPSETRMCDGFPGDGWEPLIRRMSEKIEQYCVGTDMCCAQIKEKGGVLRVYLLHPHRPHQPIEVRAAVDEAIQESARTCEGCGAPGRLRKLRWCRTLCADCATFAAEWERRRFGRSPADEEWQAQFRGDSGRLLHFEAARSRWQAFSEIQRHRLSPTMSDEELSERLGIDPREEAKWRRVAREEIARDRKEETTMPTGSDDQYKQLLARRIPRESVIIGRAYVIHARNGGVGVAVEEDGLLGYRLHREKFGEHYLFIEYDWDEDPNFGTAIPLMLIETEPPTNEDELLAWLTGQTNEHRAEIDAAWEVILGFLPGRRPPRRPPIRVWLDDEREAPTGWTHVKTASEAIRLLEVGNVDELSLDHDLGDVATCGCGHDVCVWIEEAVATRAFEPPSISIHSANPVGRQRMARAIDSIERLRRARQP